MIHSNCSSAILCTQSKEAQIHLSQPSAFAWRGALSLISAENLQCTSALTIFSSEQEIFYTVFVSQNTLTSQGVSIRQSICFLFLLKQIIIVQRKKRKYVTRDFHILRKNKVHALFYSYYFIVFTRFSSFPVPDTTTVLLKNKPSQSNSHSGK